MNKKPVLYMQTDRRWAKKPYRVTGEAATIGGSGCGPTCAAMLIETLTGKTFTPEDACAWSAEHGYKALNQGTYYSYFVPQFRAYGIACERLNTANVYGCPNASVHDKAKALLKDGWYLIACMGKGLWTKSGHYIVVWWADGRIHINDPASKLAQRTAGEPATFRKQVKYYWAIDARAHNKEEPDLTKEEIIAIVREVLAEEKSKIIHQPVSDWADESWSKATSKRIFDGTSPRNALTREQAAAVLDRLGLLDGLEKARKLQLLGMME